MPAASPPAGEVTVSLQDRSSGPLHTIAFPNFPSTTDDVTVQFNDFTQAATATRTTTHRARRHHRHHHRRSRRHGVRRSRRTIRFTG
jgi:hypothetical protein